MIENDGFTPQREYKRGMTLNIYHICLIGMIFAMMFSNFVQTLIPRQFSLIVLVFGFVLAICIVLPSRKNIGHKMIEEILCELLYVIRMFCERVMKYV